MRDTISIRSPASTARSTDGAPIVSETTVLADVWAQVIPNSGSELYRDRNRWEVQETDFIIRYSTVTISPSMTLHHDGDTYDIKAVIDTDNRHREIKLITKRHS